MRKVKPLNDFIFKKLFGEKGNEDILLSFINAVLQRTHKETVVEITKFRRKEHKDYKENSIERWLAFFEKDIPETTLGELISMDSAIKKAEQKIEYLSSDENAMKIYWERERSLHERANMISSAEKRGKLEVAKNLLDILDDETIALKTGLSIDEIRKLRSENI